MGIGVRENRGPLMAMGGALALMSGGIALYAFASRAVIRAAYEGHAWAPLNDLIRGQSVHPVEHYLADADRLLCGMVIATSACLTLCMLMLWRRDGVPRWRRLGRSLQADARALAAAGCGWLRHESRWHLAALLGIFGVGTTARLHYLDQPIRFDEAMTVTMYAAKPTWWALSSYYYPNNHLLHTTLVQASIAGCGDAPWAVRLPAFLAGLALMPTGYVAARLLYGRTAALLTSAFLAGSSILIEFSCNARGYTLMLFFTLASVAMAQLVKRRPSPGTWFLLATGGVLGMFTMPIMVGPFAIVMLWLVVSVAVCETTGPSRAFLMQWFLCVTGAALSALLLYMPVITFSGWAALADNRYIQTLGWADFLEGLPEHLSQLWRQWTRDLSLPGQVLLVSAGALGLLRHKVVARHKVPLLFIAALTAVPALLLKRAIYVSPRIWLFLLPLVVLTAAGGAAQILDSLARRTWAWLVPAVAVVVAVSMCAMVVDSNSVLDSNETGACPDAGPTARFLKECLRPGDRVLASGLTIVPMVYYFSHERMAEEHTMPLDHSALRCFIVVDVQQQETPAMILTSAISTPLANADPSRAVPLKRFGSLHVYVLELRE